MTKIHKLNEAAPLPAGEEPSKEIIEHFERLLAEARKGAYLAVASVMVLREGHVRYTWLSPFNAGHALVAGTQYLNRELITHSTKEFIEVVPDKFHADDIGPSGPWLGKDEALDDEPA